MARFLLVVFPVAYVCVAGCSTSSVELSDHSCSADKAKITASLTPTQNPLVARYTVVSSCSVKAIVEFGTDTSYGQETSSGTNNILVAGMRQFTTYHMRARLDFPDGSQVFDSDRVFTTGGLPPERLPTVSVTRSPTFEPGPGIELIDAVNLSTSVETSKVNAAAFDLEGNLIWFYDLKDGSGIDSAFPIKMLPSGNFLMVVIGAFNGVREIDLSGKTISQFSVDDINKLLALAGSQTAITSLHHEILPLANGHIILLANFGQTIAQDGPEAVGDALIDLDEQRRPVWVWSAFDHLDINRQPFGLPDWTHANAVIYSPDDGNLIVSLRNQNWVVKIDYRDGRGNGSVLWRLGPGGDFAIFGGDLADLNYAQHYPVLIGPQNSGIFPLMLFDNGNARVVDSVGNHCGLPEAIPCYSRPVIFELDENSRTAKIEWQYKAPFFSPCCGNANVLQNGNVEFDAISFEPVSSRIQEVTQISEPQLVWQMDLTGQLAYRAFRIPSLYPGVAWRPSPVAKP